MKRRGDPRDGFSLPEVLVALLILSGLFIAAFDTLRAFERVRARATNVDRAVTSRVIAERGLGKACAVAACAPSRISPTTLVDALKPTQRPLATIDADTLTLRSTPAPIDLDLDHARFEPLALVTVGGRTLPLVFGITGAQSESYAVVIGQRVNAPTPCAFDPVARACRQ